MIFLCCWCHYAAQSQLTIPHTHVFPCITESFTLNCATQPYKIVWFSFVTRENMWIVYVWIWACVSVCLYRDISMRTRCAYGKERWYHFYVFASNINSKKVYIYLYIYLFMNRITLHDVCGNKAQLKTAWDYSLCKWQRFFFLGCFFRTFFFENGKLSVCLAVRTLFSLFFCSFAFSLAYPCTFNGFQCKLSARFHKYKFINQ